MVNFNVSLYLSLNNTVSGQIQDKVKVVWKCRRAKVTRGTNSHVFLLFTYSTSVFNNQNNTCVFYYVRNTFIHLPVYSVSIRRNSRLSQRYNPWPQRTTSVRSCPPSCRLQCICTFDTVSYIGIFSNFYQDVKITNKYWNDLEMHLQFMYILH